MKLKINFGLAKKLLAKKMNINLLKEKANARITKFLNRNKKTTIYGIGDNFFDTLDELRAFCGANKRSTTGWFKLEYLGYYEGKKNVIRVWNENSNKLCAVGNIPTEKLETLGLTEYTYYESYDERTGNWRVYQGSLITKYRAFRNRGVKFNSDIYAPVEEFLDEVKPTPTEPTTGGKQITLGTK